MRPSLGLNALMSCLRLYINGAITTFATFDHTASGAEVRQPLMRTKSTTRKRKCFEQLCAKDSAKPWGTAYKFGRKKMRGPRIQYLLLDIVVMPFRLHKGDCGGTSKDLLESHWVKRMSLIGSLSYSKIISLKGRMKDLSNILPRQEYYRVNPFLRNAIYD